MAKAKKLVKPKVETVTITADDGSEDGVEIETLAESIVKIGKAAEKLSKSGVNRLGIVVLLKHHTGIPMREINLVLDGLEELKEKYTTTT